jgi:glycosyltransferase involved in cell wall biosynthesis
MVVPLDFPYRLLVLSLAMNRIWAEPLLRRALTAVRSRVLGGRAHPPGLRPVSNFLFDSAPRPLDYPVQFSIIIPTYNRSRLLSLCLAALAQQTEPADHFEVIVVVDGSTDDTREMLSRLETPYRLRVRVQANRGPGPARNAGFAGAAGDYCLFLDDDIVAGPELVRAHLRLQRERPGVVGLGRVATTPIKTAHGFVRHRAQEWTRLSQQNNRPTFLACWGANVCAPRKALEAVGGFADDLRYSEDVELGYRLEGFGLSFAFVEAGHARQLYDKDFHSLAIDTENLGAAAVELSRRHPALRALLPVGAFNRYRWAAAIRRLTLPFKLPIGLLSILDRLIDHLPETWRCYGYGFLGGHLYWRGVRRAVGSRGQWKQLTDGVVILTYHEFARSRERASRFATPARRFEWQMAWLRRLRYNVLSLEEYVRYRQEHALPPSRCVVINLDDANIEFQAIALPILRRHGLPATVSAFAQMRAAGKPVACGIEEGPNDPATPLFNLRRTEIPGDCSRLRFALALWTGTTCLRPGRSMFQHGLVAEAAGPETRYGRDTLEKDA